MSLAAAAALAATSRTTSIVTRTRSLFKSTTTSSSRILSAKKTPHHRRMLAAAATTPAANANTAENVDPACNNNSMAAPPAKKQAVAATPAEHADDAPLRVRRLVEAAMLPVRGSALAAGYDVSSAEDAEVPARGKALVSTGLVVAVPEGTYGRVAPRSGLAWKHFIDVGAGVIDADYRGELKVLLFNHSDAAFKGEVVWRIWRVVFGGTDWIDGWGPGRGERASERKRDTERALSCRAERPPPQQKKPPAKNQNNNSFQGRPRRAAGARAHRHARGRRGRRPGRHGARRGRVWLDGRGGQAAVRKKKRRGARAVVGTLRRLPPPRKKHRCERARVCVCVLQHIRA